MIYSSKVYEMNLHVIGNTLRQYRPCSLYFSTKAILAIHCWNVPSCQIYQMNNSKTKYIIYAASKQAIQEALIISSYFQSSDFGEEDKILLFESTDSAVAFEQFDTDGDGEVKRHF